jgi:5-methylcytosine-specific restriction endonuclease McrA
LKVNVRNPNQLKTDVTEEGRVCTKCQIFKTWENYRTNNKVIGTKKQSSCKQCGKEHRKAVGRTKEKYSRKKRQKVLKSSDPVLFKARSIRSKLLSRVSGDLKITTPKTEEILEWLLNTPLVCYYSGEPLDLFKLHVDHKTPLVYGGTNELSNLCLASHHMNTAKGRMNEKEFKQLLDLISTWDDKGQSLLRRLKQGRFG